MSQLRALTSRAIRGITGRAMRCASRIRYRALKKFYVRNTDRWQTTSPLIESPGCDAPWIFYDETWIHVVHRWKFRAALARGETVDATDPPRPLSPQINISRQGGISVRGEADSSDKWFYLYLDPELCPWENYSWKFTMCCTSKFKEIQFAFRYHDFYNRYRYRFQDNKLSFDMVVNGQFIADLSSVPCTIEIGHQYDIEIKVYGNNFECWVDGRLMSQDYDPEHRFPIGPIAVILWEDDGVTPIRMDLSLERISELRCMDPMQTR